MDSILRLALALLALCAPVRKEGRVIAAHHSLLRVGGVSSLDYVQDGLYYQLDGIENAGRGVHDASASTWSDLTGNGRDATFINGKAWKDDACYLAGATSDHMAKIRGVPSFTAFTLEIVFKGGTAESYARIFDNEAYFQWVENRRFGALVYTSRYPNHPAIEICTTVDNEFSLVPPCHGMSAPMSLSIYPSVSGSTITGASASANGQFKQTVTYSTSAGTVPQYMDVANRSSTPDRGMDMDVYAIRVYNRVLSAAEIAANYAIDKARFNLP